MLPVSVVCEFIMDIVIILIPLLFCIKLYGDIRYNDGLQKGRREQRKLARMIRRGELEYYRLME